jgi:hypothetical protein
MLIPVVSTVVVNVEIVEFVLFRDEDVRVLSEAAM